MKIIVLTTILLLLLNLLSVSNSTINYVKKRQGYNMFYNNSLEEEISKGVLNDLETQKHDDKKLKKLMNSQINYTNFQNNIETINPDYNDLIFMNYILTINCKGIKEKKDKIIKDVAKLIDNMLFSNYLKLLHKKFNNYTNNLCFNPNYFINKKIEYLSKKKNLMMLTIYLSKALIRIYYRHAKKSETGNKLFKDFVKSIMSCGFSYCRIFNISNCDKFLEIEKAQNNLFKLYQDKNARQLTSKYKDIRTFFNIYKVDYTKVEDYLDKY